MSNRNEIDRRPPQEIHLTKLRLVLLDNLRAFGLTPEREKPAVGGHAFSTWLEELTELEQDEIFGVDNMDNYRAGRMTALELWDELERVATCIAMGNGDDILMLAGKMFDEDEHTAPGNALRAIALIEHAMKRGLCPYNVAEAHAMLAKICEATGQADKAAAIQRQRVAAVITRSDAWEIMPMARELRDKPGELTPEIATQLIDLAEVVAAKARSFGLLCEAFDLLVETYFKLGNTEAMRTCRQKYLEAVKTAIEKGIPIEFNQRSNAHGRAADLCEQMGRPDEAADYRKQQLESGDGFGLLDTALAKLKSCGKAIDNETGTRLLDFLSKAVERIPEEFPERHAVAYRATAEILEALGDKRQAVEYYEYALQKNSKVGVKKRLDALKKKLPTGV